MILSRNILKKYSEFVDYYYIVLIINKINFLYKVY